MSFRNVKFPWTHPNGSIWVSSTIYCLNEKWYWLDEGEQESNPCDTREEAEQRLEAYGKWLNGESE